MKKNKKTVLCLLVVLFCTASCERPEIKPENSDTPETQENASTVSPSDRLVGTWVRYYDSNKKDTLRFSKDGTFVSVSPLAGSNIPLRMAYIREGPNPTPVYSPLSPHDA